MKTLKNGYVINKNYFRIALVLMFIFLGAAFFAEGFDFSKKPFFKCSGQLSCWNPFFISPDCEEGIDCPNGLTPLKHRQKCQEAWCEEAYLQPGEYGAKPTRMFSIFPYLTILVVALAFVINHFKYNKGFEFDKKNKGALKHEDNN